MEELAVRDAAEKEREAREANPLPECSDKRRSNMAEKYNYIYTNLSQDKYENFRKFLCSAFFDDDLNFLANLIIEKDEMRNNKIKNTKTNRSIIIELTAKTNNIINIK